MLLAVSIATLPLLTAACGIHNPYTGQNSATTKRANFTSEAKVPASGAPATAGTARRGTSTTILPAPREIPPAQPRTSHSLRSVADQFALAYAEFSAATMQQRLATLTALATPAYASRLNEIAAERDTESSPGLPPGGRVAAQLTGLALEPPQGGFDDGVVSVTLTVTLANGTVEQPFTSTYEVDLLRTGTAWRVADCDAQP